VKSASLIFAIASLIMMMAVVVLAFLGAADFFVDKALPSGIAWLLLFGSIVMGVLAGIFEFVSTVRPRQENFDG